MTIVRMALLFIAASFLSCCAEVSGEARAPAVSVPDELKGARLVYQRGQDIYVRMPGDGPAERILVDARYPRWAPDGQSLAFVRGNEVMIYTIALKQTRAVATADRPRAVAFRPDGTEIWFAAGTSIYAANVTGGLARTVAEGLDARELDVSHDGSILAMTVKGLTGYRVLIQRIPGSTTEIGRGCSASLSPDARYVTVNQRDHTEAALHDILDGTRWKTIAAPPGMKLDDQAWSNHPDWIASVGEGAHRYIMVHRVSDGKAWRVAPESDCARPDLFVETGYTP